MAGVPPAGIPPAGIPAADEGQLRLFLKAGCPFCTRLVMFLAEGKLEGKVKPICDSPAVRQ